MAEIKASYYEILEWLSKKEEENGVKATYMNAKFFLLFLEYFVNNYTVDEKNKEPFISCTYQFLGSHFDTSETVSIGRAQKSIKLLENCGIIRVEKSTGRTPSRFFLIDCPFVEIENSKRKVE